MSSTSGATTGRIMAAFLGDDGAVMRSTQYYGQTRRFQVVGVTPKTVRVQEVHRYRLSDGGTVAGWGETETKRVREDGTFTLGRWQIAYLEDPEKLAAGAYAQDFPW